MAREIVADRQELEACGCCGSSSSSSSAGGPPDFGDCNNLGTLDLNQPNCQVSSDCPCNGGDVNNESLPYNFAQPWGGLLDQDSDCDVFFGFTAGIEVEAVCQLNGYWLVTYTQYFYNGPGADEVLCTISGSVETRALNIINKNMLGEGTLDGGPITISLDSVFGDPNCDLNQTCTATVTFNP
jgi:hypothetical protein